MKILLAILFLLAPIIGLANEVDDRILHAGSTFSLAIMTGYVARDLGDEQKIILSFGVPMVAGLVKEFLIDKKPDLKDIAYNTLGSGLGAYFVYKF